MLNLDSVPGAVQEQEYLETDSTSGRLVEGHVKIYVLFQDPSGSDRQAL